MQAQYSLQGYKDTSILRSASTFMLFTQKCNTGMYFPLWRRQIEDNFTAIQTSTIYQPESSKSTSNQEVKWIKLKRLRSQSKIQYCSISWCCSNLSKCWVNHKVADSVTSCKLFLAFHQSTAQHADPLYRKKPAGIDWTACCSRWPSSHPLSHECGLGRSNEPLERVSGGCRLAVAFWGYTS